MSRSDRKVHLPSWGLSLSVRCGTWAIDGHSPRGNVAERHVFMFLPERVQCATCRRLEHAWTWRQPCATPEQELAVEVFGHAVARWRTEGHVAAHGTEGNPHVYFPVSGYHPHPARAAAIEFTRSVSAALDLEHKGRWQQCPCGMRVWLTDDGKVIWAGRLSTPGPGRQPVDIHYRPRGGRTYRFRGWTKPD